MNTDKDSSTDDAKAMMIVRTLDGWLLADPSLVEGVVTAWLDSLQVETTDTILSAEVIDER
jgi:hypothetical protein